jgi:hypothetical protein
MSMKVILLAVACALTGIAQAQPGAVPPRSRPDNSAELTQQTTKNAVIELPGAIMHGAAVMQQQIGNDGAVQMLGAAKKGGSIISYAVDGSRLLGAAVAGGGEGLRSEGAQLLFERGVNAVGDVGTTIAVRSAITGGLGAVTASGAAGIAYTGGSLIGGWARDSQWLGEKLGLEQTIGHEVDDFYWKITPDTVKEYVSGTKQVHFDSPEFQRDMEMDIARRKRQLTFDRIQRENAEQRTAAQPAAAAAADYGNSSSLSTLGDASPSTSQFLDQLNQSLRNLQTTQSRNRSSYPSAATSAKQCTIDPATGCHPGHDEKSHPGGCKCGR